MEDDGRLFFGDIDGRRWANGAALVEVVFLLDKAG